MSCAASQVTLDGIVLDLDPENYVPIDGPRRGSIHQQVGGGTIFQDRGVSPTDIRISLKGRLTLSATLASLYALYRKTGYVFRFTDFKGNDLQCIFEPLKGFVANPVRGSATAWEYSINLCCISVTTWLGASFPPSS